MAGSAMVEASLMRILSAPSPVPRMKSPERDTLRAPYTRQQTPRDFDHAGGWVFV